MTPPKSGSNAASAAVGRAEIVIEATAADSVEVAGLLASYFAEIQAAFGFDEARALPTTAAEFTPPHGRFFVVRDTEGRASGCGAVRMLDATTAEVKRMWLHPSMRGRGAGRALLETIEAAAVDLGATRAVLDTNASLASAIALYRGSDWVEVTAYNDNDQATHWFAKDLTP